MINPNLNKLREKVKTLPQLPGVYQMKNANGGVIYVGKAKRLKNRVKSYFDNSEKNFKTQTMASQVFDFDYIITNSELDAFNLENTLIKKFKPKYNILLKDDKSFPYILINRSERFPRVQIVRRPKTSKGIFGPFVTGMNVHDIVACIKSAFQVRWCNTDFSNNKQNKRPCLHGEIGDCCAPCVCKTSETEYNKMIDEIEDFLSGNTKKIKEKLTEKMTKMASNEEFEKAIEIRRQLETICLLDSSIITDLVGSHPIDVFSFYEMPELSAFNVMMIRGGKNVGQVSYPSTLYASDANDALTSFISSFYQSAGSLPKEIVCKDITLESAKLIEDFYYSKFGIKVGVSIPVKGTKLKLCDNAQKNAKEYAQNSQDRIARHTRLTTDALDELAQILEIGSIYRIEGYDISNISGTNSVASMVVFENGEPAKKEYRKFKIKTVEGANDYASLQETLSRRLTHLKNGDKNFCPAPDLILIDGGLGQLSSVRETLEQFGETIPVISLAKQDEEIFTTTSNLPIKLEKSNYALRLLQRVRDEAHRFAVTYHRLDRSKNYKSMLLDLDGLGKERTKLLYKEFKTADAIISADVSELARVKGIGKKLAEKIYAQLHDNAKN